MYSIIEGVRPGGVFRLKEVFVKELGMKEIRKVVAVPVQKILVNSEVAADLLSVSPRTIGNMIANGRLPVVKIGSCTRIRVRDLYQFANDNLKGVI